MLRLLRKIILSIALLTVIWATGLLWYVGLMPMVPSSDRSTADAIVVLTGGRGRLEHGLRLLADGRGRTLLVSGAARGTTVEDMLEQAGPRVREKLESMEELPITLGHDAVNTIGNAEETARWLRERKAKTIRVVTSNYHMPRAMSEFRQVLPDATLIPNPVFTDEFPVNGWWKNEKSRELVGLEYHKFLAGKLRHWIVSLLEEPAS